MVFNKAVENLQQEIESTKEKYARSPPGTTREAYFYQKYEALTKKLKEEGGGK